MKDLVVLIPDKNTRSVVEGLFQRKEALGIRHIEYDIYIHPGRDPGVYQQAVAFLRTFLNQYRYALVFLDREGSGQEHKTADNISSDIQKSLDINGWGERSNVIVFEPELEIWSWVNSPRFAKILGWHNFPKMKKFIVEHNLWEIESAKPKRPKEAIEIALREKRIPRSSSIYKEIAETVSFRNCTDEAFIKFRDTLVAWFTEIE
ncbi:MAG: hypothetical protein QME78_15275 [Thermodesulfobacteriota bacterium]|nr:hypothetical protein [Thermodesulfobacteriota bacterium]